MLNIIEVTFVIIGTIIGAGFASGQEVYTFFNRYGAYGLAGLVFSILCICFITYKTLIIILKNDVNTYHKFIHNTWPLKLRNNKILVDIINDIINIFLLISFNIMAARFFYSSFARI